jgi:flagellar basal-body rod modification protein FlgD
MGITNNVTPVTYTGASNSATSADNDLGPNAFLSLLTTEMENQDPDNPQDATESVTQLAQMSELQYQQQLTSDFSTFQSNFGVLQAASLVGKTATATVTNTSSDTSTTYSGTITGVQVEDGEPYFTMTNSSGTTITNSSGSPLLIPSTDITSIGGAASTGSGT